MAQSKERQETTAQIHELAEKTFPKYKEFIATEFINEFGRSYQTINEFRDSWQQAFDYRPECEDFIKFKTRIFLRMLPTDNKLYAHPHFLRVLIHNICDYIAIYTARKEKTLNTYDVSRALYNELHTENDLVKQKQKVFCKETFAKRKAEQQTVQPEKEPRKRKHFNSANAQTVKMNRIEKRRLEEKSLNQRIQEKKKELGLPIFNPHQMTDEEFHEIMKKRRESIRISIIIKAERGK